MQASKAKGKAAAAAPRAALAPSNAVNVARPTAKAKAIEDVYKKMTQLEHILARPDTYIGSVEQQQLAMWVHDGLKMNHRLITFTPGFYKIADEVIVNAADHSARNPLGSALPMTVLKVAVDAVRHLYLLLWHDAAVACGLRLLHCRFMLCSTAPRLAASSPRACR